LLEGVGETIGLTDRPRRALEANAELLLSIHHDAVDKRYIEYWRYGGRERPYSDMFSGFSLFVYRDGKQFVASYKLANLIGKMMVNTGLKPTLHHAEPIRGEARLLLDRQSGVYAAPFAVLKLAAIPAVLLEVGVIVNREEEERLEDPKHRAKSQGAIVRALLSYCSGLR
jgi:N-acetylmuramoyl-L-alanine amidase